MMAKYPDIGTVIMQPKIIAQLTEKQCACLLLVWRRMTSKEIASQLGISPYTVDQRLDSARRALGAATRYEAARIYIEAAGIPEWLGYDAPQGGADGGFAEQVPPERLTCEQFGMAGPTAREIGLGTDERADHLEQPVAAGATAPWDRSGLVATGQVEGWVREAPRRLMIIGILAVGMMTLLLLGLSVASALSELFRQSSQASLGMTR